MIECNIQEETMKVELKEPFEKIDMKSIVTDQTIDLSNEGDRWVGGCFSGVPFGFGCFYDGNNILQLPCQIEGEMKKHGTNCRL